MSKTLVIVESNSKAQTISKYLGKDYEVLASYGHIADLPPNKMGIDVNNNFAPTYLLMKDKVATLQTILDGANKCDQIFLSCDPDREGERISWDLKRYLQSFNKPISRVLFYEITKKGIKDGIKNKKDIDQNLVSSQENRRIIDRLVGFSCSPFISNHYKTPLSAGRVQSAVVKLIVDLEKKIENFKKEEYWNVSASFSNKNRETFTAKLDAKISNKEEADKMVGQISNEKGFIVSSVVAQDKEKAPNPPLITVKLQQIMAKQHGWEADRTMKSAQFLYENGFITYLRTDSVRISEEAFGPTREWLEANNFPIPKKPVKYEDKNSAQAGHECLRPTSMATSPDTKMLGGDDALVYKTIFEHFLSSQMMPAVFSTMQIKLVGAENKNIVFKVSGKALKSPGWLAIFGTKDTQKIDLPALEEGEPVKLDQKTIKPEQKFTQPPSRYNDATILEDLEAKGIGRPATYASIIKTVSARNYVEREGNIFKPTKLGRDITELLEQFFSFVDYNYTSKMEVLLDKIADGKLNCLDMLNEFYGDFKKQLDAAYVKDGHDICSCGGIMLKRKSKTGDEFYGCSSYPNCRLTKTMKEKI
jgi:DNA topoisomerase-1